MTINFFTGQMIIEPHRVAVRLEIKAWDILRRLEAIQVVWDYTKCTLMNVLFSINELTRFPEEIICCFYRFSPPVLTMLNTLQMKPNCDAL